MKKLLYIFLIAGTTATFPACSPDTNDSGNQLEGQGTDAEGNIRTDNVGTQGGAPISDQASGAAGQNTNIREDLQAGTITDDANMQQDNSTGTGLNPGRVDADTTPNTGRTSPGATGTGTTSGQNQGSGQRGTGADTEPVKR